MISKSHTWPRWVRALAWGLVGLAAVAGLWTAATNVNVSDEIQSAVESLFADLAEGNLTVGETSWGWGYIEFTDVSARSPYLPGALDVRSVRVRVNLFRFVFEGFSVENVVEAVELHGPRLTLSDSLVSWASHMRSLAQPGDSLRLRSS